LPRPPTESDNGIRSNNNEDRRDQKSERKKAIGEHSVQFSDADETV
jgi:hypothetical protein